MLMHDTRDIVFLDGKHLRSPPVADSFVVALRTCTMRFGCREAEGVARYSHLLAHKLNRDRAQIDLEAHLIAEILDAAS